MKTTNWDGGDHSESFFLSCTRAS